MERLLQWLRAGLFLAAILLCAKTFVVLDRIDKAVFAMKTDVNTLTDDSVEVLDDAHRLLLASTHTVNAAHVTITQARPKVKLALDDAHHLLLEAGLTAMEARKAATEQRAYWDKSGKETVALLGKVNGLADELTVTDKALTKAVEDADRAVQHADLVISDPAITSTLAHADGTMKNIETVSARFAKPASAAKAVWMGILDIAYKIHSFLP